SRRRRTRRRKRRSSYFRQDAGGSVGQHPIESQRENRRVITVSGSPWEEMPGKNHAYAQDLHMNSIASVRPQNPFAMLRQMAQLKSETDECEFCSLPLQAAHRHLLEIATRKIICACDACALRFDNVVGRWKLIPRDARGLPGFHLTEAD